MATNVSASGSIRESDISRTAKKTRTVGWETIALVVGILVVSVAMLYLPYLFSNY